jgi:hypothetical protein
MTNREIILEALNAGAHIVLIYLLVFLVLSW